MDAQGRGPIPENRFIFETVKPGPIGDGQAPHLNVIVFMRGMPLHAFTRIYFSDETSANDADPLLRSVPEERRQTLIGERQDGPGRGVYVFDVHLRGEQETVFLDA